MTGDRPRHSRKEIRNFADELDKGGWTFEDVDASGHTIWSHPARRPGSSCPRRRSTSTFSAPDATSPG